MKVFISWSGPTSRQLAEALADWIPKVIQGIRPFVSAKDIDKGANWTVVLSQELEDAQFGIICLAPDNLLSPWLNYEAGAIMKSVSSRVCPVLIGLDKGAVRAPLSQLQMTSLDLEDIRLLMRSMNVSAGKNLSEHALDEAVNVWWPLLELEVGSIHVPGQTDSLNVSPEPEKPEPSATEMLAEVLSHVRALDRRLESLEGHRVNQRPAQRTMRDMENVSLRITDTLAAFGVSPLDTDMRRDGSLIVRIPSMPTGDTRRRMAIALADLTRRHGVEIQIGSEDDWIQVGARGVISDPLLKPQRSRFANSLEISDPA